MKAAYLESTGGPEVIQYGDLPAPEPKAGEALVKVGAVSVNPIDTYIRSGMVAMQMPKPFIPGCDLAGTIDKVGPGIKRFKVGDRVWASNMGRLGRQGSFAEYACVPEELLHSTPANVPDEEAAAVALVGITAHLGLFQWAKLQPGETAFVNGGTGGVGSMVIQMAKAVGAKAITTIGSPEKASQARELGADLAINYKSEDIVAKVKEFTGGKGVDVWYETQPPTDFDKTFEAMASRGRVIVMAGRSARPVFPNGPFYVKGLTMIGFSMLSATPAEQKVCADDMNRWLAEKKLKALIGKHMKLSEAAGAHRLQEENTLKKAGTLSGKIVLVP
jgi:NADPH:quinone reductase